MVIFNNICLRHVQVSFYNVARSLTIVFNVFFSRVFLGIPTSLKTMLCLGFVISGFAIGTRGEINFSLIGTISGVMSSLFVSLNSIFTKKVLPVVDDNHWRLTFYNNVNATILFLPLIFYFEGEIIRDASKTFMSPAFWSAMLLAGFFGFSIGIVTVLQIKATSPLSHNISGTAKAAVQSLMAFYLWGNRPTVMGVLGIFTVLGGSLLYTFVRMNENALNAPPPPPPQQQMSSNVWHEEGDNANGEESCVQIEQTKDDSRSVLSPIRERKRQPQVIAAGDDGDDISIATTDSVKGKWPLMERMTAVLSKARFEISRVFQIQHVKLICHDSLQIFVTP